MKRPIILIIGIEEILRQQLKGKLVHHGFRVIEAAEKINAAELYQTIKPDLAIICSYQKNSGDGLKEVEELRQIERSLPIILITRFGSEESVISALRERVNDYFRVPFSSDAVITSIKRCLSGNISQPSSEDETKLDCFIKDQLFVCESRQMREIKAYLLKVAKTDSTVLITGETGTGKELASGLIHLKSTRNNKPFVCINCAALPESLVESELFGYDKGAFTGAVAMKCGKFELASGGTVFLDEIGEMNPYAQAKILRIIESKEFYRLGGKRQIPMNARVIAATNQDPERLLAEGRLRKDLYYRLNIVRVHLPPLRDRKKDIPCLVHHAIRKLNHRFCREVEGLSDETMACLLRYDWPGNIRELMNLLEATFISLPSRHIPYIGLPKQLQKQLKVVLYSTKEERNRIVRTLLETNWNKSTAAQKLNWSRMTLYRKIEKYNIVEKRSPAR